MCLILNGYRVRAVWIPRPKSVRFLFGEIYTKKVDTRDDSLGLILDAAALTKKRKDKLTRTTRNFRTRVSRYTEVYGGIFKHLLWTVTNLSLQRNKIVV